MSKKILMLFLIASVSTAIGQHLAPIPSSNIIAFNDAPLTAIPIDGSLIVGGRFLKCAPYNTGIATVDPVSGKMLNDIRFDNGGSLVVSDSGGGYYLLVGATPPVKYGTSILKRIQSDGKVLYSVSLFVNGVDRFSGTIECIAAKGDTVYLGGRFSTINGIPRNSIAAIEASSGTILDFNPTVDSNVQSMVIYGNDIVIGGLFDTVLGQPRTALARINRYQGVLHDWPIMPTALMQTKFNDLIHGYNRLVVSNGILYTIRGAIDLSTGISTSWKPVPENIPLAPYPIPQIVDVDVSAGRIIAVGEFTGINGRKRNGIAVFDEKTGELTETDPNKNWLDHYSFLSANYSSVQCVGSIAYIGGMDNFIGRKSIDGLAACDILTGEIQKWEVACLRQKPGAQYPSKILYADQSRIFVLGSLGSIGHQIISRNGLVELSNSGDRILEWNPNFSKYVRQHYSDTVVQISSILIIGNIIYIGGDFDSVNGVARKNLCAFERTTRRLLPWNPRVQGQIINTMAYDNSTLYIAGKFDSINGTEQRFVGAIDAVTGAIKQINIKVDTVVNLISIYDQRLYIAGEFKTVNDKERNGFAVIDIQNGTLLQEGPMLPALASVTAMLVADSIVYLSGTRLGAEVTPIINPIGGKMALAGYNRITGVVRWQPNYSIPTNVKASSLVLHHGILYAGALMRNSDNGGKSYITTTGIFQYNPITGEEIGRTLSSNTPIILSIINDTIFAAGHFDGENGWSGMEFFARYDPRQNLGIIGVKNQKNHFLHLWPNPVNDFIEVNTVDLKSTILKIINTHGDILEEYDLTKTKLIDVGHLPIGQYIAQVGAYSTKFTVSR